MMRISALVLLIPVVAGCALIDQRTFERQGQAPGAAQLARTARLAAAKSAPLVIVFPADLTHDWTPDVLAATRNALVHDASAEFDLVTPIPTARPPEAQREAAATGAADAQAVAAVMQGDGVAAERLHFGARGDAGNPPRMVMVYLR